ncbi:MAG: hypothetical protein WA117_05560 [Verrucomicrobiia bacterium]
MHLPFPILASGDSWIGLLIFIIIAIVSSFSKMMQKGQEPEMPEELPRPLPPRPVPPQYRSPAAPQRPQATPSGQTRRSLTEEQVQEVLRRMRRPAQQQAPPPVIEPIEEAPRRMVALSREESALPSERPEARPPHVEPLSAHPEPAPHEEMPSTAQPSKPAVPVSALPARTSLYRERLRSRNEIRRAIVLREVLGPPLALRQDW